jgi:TPR repeat protein
MSRATLADLTLPRGADARAIVSAVRRWGIAVLPGFLSADEVARLVAEHRKALTVEAEEVVISPTPTGEMADLNPGRMDRAAFPTVHAVFRNPLFRTVAERYLGRPFCFNYEIYATYEHRTSTPIIDLHFDKVWTFKNYFYLQDTDRAGGAIGFVPGSHRFGRRVARAHISRAQGRALSVRDPHYQAFPNTVDPKDHGEAVYIEAPAGTLIFFDSDVLHCAHALGEGRERRIIRSVSCTLLPPIVEFRKYGRQWWRGASPNPARWAARLLDLDSPLPLRRWLDGTSHGDALLRMGEAYRTGLGVDRDYRESARWLTRAAGLGSAEAWFQLGQIHGGGGFGMPVDHEAAATCWARAGEMGWAAGWGRLGTAHATGLGVAKDEARAAELWERAASAGDPDAMVDLARARRDGAGTPADPASAASWLDRAYLAALGEYQSARYDRSAALLRRLVDLGHTSAMTLLAESYRRGAGVSQRADRAVELWTAAMAGGDATAAFAMGEAYANGLPGLAPDSSAARRAWSRALELGYESARARLEAATPATAG